MSLRGAGSLIVLFCLALAPTLVAQKGGKPKPQPVDNPGTVVFRCNGPTAAAHTDANGAPDGSHCGPWTIPDGITGDGNPYVGVGVDATSGSGPFLRSDGEFTMDIRAGDGRLISLNFENWVTLPGAYSRKTFEFADLNAFHINTNVIIPNTEDIAPNGLLSIPVGGTWPTRIKAGWKDAYGVLYNIRFNPTSFPGSTHAWITRTADNSWILSASDRDIARLVSPGADVKGKPTGPVNEGSYAMPFELTFTLP
jgi:hypothetical protein